MNPLLCASKDKIALKDKGPVKLKSDLIEHI